MKKRQTRINHKRMCTFLVKIEAALDALPQEERRRVLNALLVIYS